MNLDEQIKCAARELKLRQNVYPKWVAAGRMKEAAATYETEAMAAILETLKVLKKSANLGPGTVNWCRPHDKVVFLPPGEPNPGE